jgi:ATP-binding cassette subfamily B (MDR/TAP) protein 1
MKVLSASATELAAYAESASYAAEAITAIRTVSAFCLEEHVLQTYENIVAETVSTNLRSPVYASALYPASQSVVFLVAALGFWYGGTLIGDHSYTMLQYFVFFAALVSGSQSVGVCDSGPG